jgi:hypothetical protein
LSGPAGDPASRNPATYFHVFVQGHDAAQVVVGTPSGDIIAVPPYSDVWGWERRFLGGIEGMPQAGGLYTFTALDADGAPIPEGVCSDVYLGGYEPDPPANVQVQVVEAGILVTWDPSPVIPGAFDPGGSPPVGGYQIVLHREGGEEYGWHNWDEPLYETSHLIPFQRQDFGPGDRGMALEEMGDGVYSLMLSAHSFAPEGTAGRVGECVASDSAWEYRVIIEGGQIRVEKP